MSIQITGIDMPKGNETLILAITSDGVVKKLDSKKIPGAKASSGTKNTSGVQRDKNGAIITEIL